MLKETDSTAQPTNPEAPAANTGPGSDELASGALDTDELGSDDLDAGDLDPDEDGSDLPAPPAALDPAAEQERSDRKARHVYLWLWVSAFLTVPWMSFNMSGFGATSYVLAVASPALVHLVLLLGLSSPSLFARRHTQQGLLLALARTLSE